MGRTLKLPEDILGSIIIMLVTSCNGATDLARLSATCRFFRDLAGKPFILKVVNLEKISTDDYRAHHHMNDLLFLCARAGNPAAEFMLGKALLHNGKWFWKIIMDHDTLLGRRLLQHPKLVRSFICHASGEVLGRMRIPFFSYMISFLGHDLARSSGIINATSNLCLYELKRAINNTYDETHTREYVSLHRLNPAIYGLSPLSGPSYREKLLEIFDEMFLM